MTHFCIIARVITEPVKSRWEKIAPGTWKLILKCFTVFICHLGECPKLGPEFEGDDLSRTRELFPIQKTFRRSALLTAGNDMSERPMYPTLVNLIFAAAMIRGWQALLPYTRGDILVRQPRGAFGCVRTNSPQISFERMNVTS